MSFIALVLMLATAAAALTNHGDWAFWLFVGAVLAQLGAVYDSVQRWRKAAK